MESSPLDQLEIEDHVITKADRARSHDHLSEVIADHNEGLFGPDSMFWKMLEPLPVLPHMLVIAGLLEGGAPKIWFGTENTVTRSGDYGSRFARSYDAFASWFLGDLESCLKMSRKVNGYHSMVGGVAPDDAGHVRAGQHYRATEQQLMIWTWATQILPIKEFYELVVRPLTPAELAQYYEECKRFALIFGIAENALPPDWAAFDRFWQDSLTSGELALAKEGHDRFGPLMDQSQFNLPTRIFIRSIMAMEFNLMPESLRIQYEAITPLAKKRPWAAKTGVLCFKIVVRALPDGLTTAPRVRAARRRVGAAGRPLRFERRLAARLPHPFGGRTPTLNTPASPEADPRNSKAFALPPV